MLATLAWCRLALMAQSPVFEPKSKACGIDTLSQSRELQNLPIHMLVEPGIQFPSWAGLAGTQPAASLLLHTAVSPVPCISLPTPRAFSHSSFLSCLLGLLLWTAFSLPGLPPGLRHR